MGLFNATCPLPKGYVDLPNAEEPIVGSIKFQQLMLYIAAACTVLTTFFTVSLMVKHLLCYTRPREQRQIIRIVFYPLVFAIFSMFSIYSYPDSLYLEPAQEIYEPVALVSLFFLYVEYAAPDQESRELYFHQLDNRKQKGGRWSRKKGYDVIPGGSLRWYQSKWVAVFFYFFATVVIHIVEEITQTFGRYCSSSFSPAFAHVWVMVISDLALPVGVLAVVQFYLRMKDDAQFHAHKPLTKLLSFKAIIFLSFFQAILFDILTGTHVLKGSKTATFKDLSVGLPALLITFEQMLVSIWFQFTFGTLEYRDAQKEFSTERLGIWRAAANALNPSDLFQGFTYAVRLLVKGVGPKGNGSWGRSGGYDKLAEHADVHLKPSSEYGASRTTSNTGTGYADRWAGDEEQGLGAQDHNVLLPTQAQMGTDYQA